jgi:cell shape-determining protein MreD
MFHVKQPGEALWRPVRKALSAYTFPRPLSSNPSRESHPINLVSALLALATGLVHASLAPLLAMGDVRPNLILAAVVAVTALLGLSAGATWAFVGGLTANLLTTDALGTIPLGLLLVAGLVTLMSRAVGRHPAALALVGGLVGSIVLDALAIGVFLVNGGTGGVIRPPDLVAVVVPSAIVNGLLAVALYLVARTAMTRLGYEPLQV